MHSEVMLCVHIITGHCSVYHIHVNLDFYSSRHQYQHPFPIALAYAV